MHPKNFIEPLKFAVNLVSIISNKELKGKISNENTFK